jgi:hypothetical protein
MKKNPVDTAGGSKRKVSVSLSPEIINKIESFVHPDPAVTLTTFSAKAEFFLRRSVGTIPTHAREKR